MISIRGLLKKQEVKTKAYSSVQLTVPSLSSGETLANKQEAVCAYNLPCSGFLDLLYRYPTFLALDSYHFV